ncbi:MAG: chemotaxis protein CheW [Sedimentibacter sp.]
MNYDTEEILEEIDFPWLIFKLNNNLYTLSSKMITSIVIKPDEITFVPNVKDYITGLIHLRGNVVPLIDLKELLNIDASNNLITNENKMVVVLEKENSFAGLIVDEVLSVESITPFEETEEIKKMCREGFVKGVAKGNKNEDVLLIIDEEKIMNLA